MSHYDKLPTWTKPKIRWRQPLSKLILWATRTRLKDTVPPDYAPPMWKELKQFVLDHPNADMIAVSPDAPTTPQDHFTVYLGRASDWLVGYDRLDS
jgi:hypothetical protein